MKIGYVRVSVQRQNIERQLDSLKEAGCERIFIDKISGAKSERPELAHMFDCIRAGDEVIVTELSRFGRSVKDLIEMAERLEKIGAAFKSLKESFIDTTTESGKLVFTIFSALAEFERELIVSRTKEGLSAARARGRKGGRPLKDPAAVDTAIKLYNSGDLSIKEIVRRTGVSKSCLYHKIKSRSTPRSN